MQTKNPFLDEVAKLGEQAWGMAQAAGEEARTAMRAQGERFAVELDLVRRDELDTMRAVLEAQIAALRAEVAALRTAGDSTPVTAAPVDEARASDDAG